MDTIHLPAPRRFLSAAFMFAVMAVAVLGACQGHDPAEAASVAVGITLSEANALILTAQDLGYFADNGLNVTHTAYASDRAALDALFDGQVQMATGSEFALASKVLSGQELRALAIINRASSEYLVARTGRGIGTVADLEGRTIGVPLGSRPEFALDRFLYFRGLDAGQVTLADVPADRSVDALINESVDAVAALQPYVYQIQERLGEGVVAWSLHDGQLSYTLVMCQAGWAAESGEVIVRFLRALVQAEDYVARHPEAARNAIQERLDYSADYMDSVWPGHSFTILLDQGLIVTLEDQARWIIDNNLSSDVPTPDFAHYLYLDGLEAVKPRAVSVIR